MSFLVNPTDYSLDRVDDFSEPIPPLFSPIFIRQKIDTMGFMSHRRRDVDVPPEQKWDFIVRGTLGELNLRLKTTPDR